MKQYKERKLFWGDDMDPEVTAKKGRDVEERACEEVPEGSEAGNAGMRG